MNLTKKSLVPEVMVYGPTAESLQDIVHFTSPSGKRILALAGYGYPLVFLAEGANEVVSFEIDSKRVAWNYFLREATRIFDYEQFLALFKEQSIINGI